MSANELAGILCVPANRIAQILAGKRGITADTALRLGQWLGTGPEIWLNLQKAYELRLAQAKPGTKSSAPFQPVRQWWQPACKHNDPYLVAIGRAWYHGCRKISQPSDLDEGIVVYEKNDDHVS